MLTAGAEAALQLRLVDAADEAPDHAWQVLFEGRIGLALGASINDFRFQGSPGRAEGTVRTVKMLGSGWSKATALTGLKRAMSYLRARSLQVKMNAVTTLERIRSDTRHVQL